MFLVLSAAMAVEISSESDFEVVVRRSPRAFLVEFYSGMCGSCQAFEPTWHELTREASRLESARVNIDTETGMELAERLGILDLGIPAVVFYGSDQYDPLMTGDIFPLSRLLKRVYRRTRGFEIDEDGFFLRRRGRQQQRGGDLVLG
ncbi:hypothetical protein CTAYLR_004848 [Chrysophaeum taylorii]|uniref:Thioredoxin domain-containing protein n=1 Tax=Chrysophaeum taylorii TaxID=2483200 RepID=A0AAD7UE68_9STRA|nr:hypothetical protein CTAYLR_004848 [Chrysophaeum taylorii]